VDPLSKCHIGVAFKENFVGLLTQAKFFLPSGDKSIFPANLKFQGSNDNITFTDIYTADELIREGWNSIMFGDSEDIATPKYRFYRFLGSMAGVCNINEIELYGVETIDNNNADYEVTPALYIGGSKVKDLGVVTYSGSITPKLTLISPRYGTVEGGETITFTGTGFS
jgi:hypothetical protein